MAKRRLPDLADDHRCTRNGTNWRCHLPRLPGKSYCQKHHLFNLARSKARSKSQLAVAIPAAHNSSNLREIWALHRTPGGLPRLYARVERRIPNQSLVEATPLIPHPDPTADASCGFFRPSDSTEMMQMGAFSHRVWFEVEGGGEELYKIFPRKGEIWAVEQYGWVEMVSSFGDYEGASGLVLVEEEEEGDGVFRRRLYEECELIRRFSMEEMWMFAYRVSNARIVGGHSEGLLLQACTVVVEGENATSLQREETTYHQSEACGNSLNENNVEAQAPDLISNEGESAQSSGGISNMECAGSGGLTSVAIVEYNHQQPEICIINLKEVSEQQPVEPVQVSTVF